MFLAPYSVGGCNLPIPMMLQRSEHIVMESEIMIMGFFPLHDVRAARKLKNNVLQWWTLPWTIGFNEIKEYFGEKFALLFV